MGHNEVIRWNAIDPDTQSCAMVRAVNRAALVLFEDICRAANAVILLCADDECAVVQAQRPAKPLVGGAIRCIRSRVCSAR